MKHSLHGDLQLAWEEGEASEQGRYMVTFTRADNGQPDMLRDADKPGMPLMTSLTHARALLAYANDPGWPDATDFKISRITGLRMLTTGCESRTEDGTEHLSFDVGEIVFETEAVTP